MNPNQSQVAKNQEVAGNLCKELGSATYQSTILEKQLKMLVDRKEAIQKELDALERVTRELTKEDADSKPKIQTAKK